ncbi:MAG: tyrosine-type recombinase/integrase [Candidatus Didemnitutus sp.]|nr:tyrosine-type recombinase/integrase [Candidatus Didemnitutus sp.]
MEATKREKMWERTNVTNLLRNRQSGTYYARVKANGKQKWRSLKTTVFTVAKLRLADVERDIRAQGATARGDSGTATDPSAETKVATYIAAYRATQQNDSKLKASSLERKLNSVKALVKTWPELPDRDVRRLTESDCQTWATKAKKEGTGFIAPNVKTKRAGMSASAFNKCVDALLGILEIAKAKGLIYKNPAEKIVKLPIKPKPFDLPSNAQFKEMVRLIATAGSRWSTDAAEMVRLLAFTGARLNEARRLRWFHLNEAETLLTVPGTKSEKSIDRPLPLFKPLAELLTEIRNRRGPETAHTPIARLKTCMDALKSACRKVGVKEMDHHDLRHYFATRCIESGVDIPTLSRWLGHADGGVLAMKTYGHLRQEHSLAQATKVVF